jgi:hypothetical protein
MVWGGIMLGALQPAFECVGKTELGHDLANGIDDYGKMVSASPGLRRRTEPLDLLVDWSELGFTQSKHVNQGFVLLGCRQFATNTGIPMRGEATV